MEEVNNMKIVKTPAEKYLLTVNSKTTNLDAEKVDVFHTKFLKHYLYARGKDQMFNQQCHFYAL